jgi:uncharacterized caspase-like protein
LQNHMTSDDVGVVYFAGQLGRDSQDVLYLLPHDARSSEPAKSGLAETVLLTSLQKTAGKLVLLLDAPLVEPSVAGVAVNSKSKPAAPRVRRFSDDLLRDLASEDYGIAVIGAAGAHDALVKPATGGHSVFAQAVLDGLGGQADANADGAVEVQELARFVKSRVKEKTAGAQRPVTAHPALVPGFTLSYR